VSIGVILLIALGGTLAIEGALWAVLPGKMRQMYEESFAMGDRVLHLAGLASVALGIAMLAYGVKLGAL